MIGRLIEWSLRNRFLVACGVLFIIAFGIFELRRTPVDAVPIGVFTNTGSSEAAAPAASSARFAATKAGGCGSPSLVSVRNAATLSWTWASAPKSGTAVRSPAAVIRSLASDITSTCS